MGPIRYARLWRLRSARDALVLANPLTSSVAKIANQFSFSELGQFSVAYRALFGESPLVTLRRPLQSVSPKAPATPFISGRQ
jgi:transcriptional regulator GlxA family with amidase domain